METKKTFFSYSRTDSEFTLKLAKDLRDAGVPIWLDQLDIEAGSRWDASIEAALEAAGRLIVVLSPESVASVNVMDEVAYALENNIPIIPVLLAECKTPFRISRLQRIDFSGDYQTGLKNLQHALKLGGEATPKQAAPAHSKKAAIASQQTTVPGKKSNPLKYILLGAVLVILIIWGLASIGPDDSGQPMEDSTETTVADGAMLQPGDAYQGGIVFEIDSSGEHGLIAAKEDIGGFLSYDQALEACEALEIDGFSDWYLPNTLELRKLYLNRELIGGFEGIDYWSSSEDPNDPDKAYGFRFDVEGVSQGGKEEAGSVRAIRKF